VEPEAFDPLGAIEGQPEAVALLRRAVEGGQVAHAYAFVGPRGSGRRTTALALAQALVAPEGGPAAARVLRGAHPDVIVIEPTPPEDNPRGAPAIRIGDIRGLERLAGLTPLMGRRKVFIVDEAERMTAATPQAFLKTLEEPPPRTVIVLVLTQLRALPATVLSRCQVVRFRPRAQGPVAGLPPADGPERDEALAWLDRAGRQGLAAVLDCGEAVGRDRQVAERLVETWWLCYRDLLCRAAGGGGGLAVLGDRGPASGPAAGRPVEEVVAGLAACREASEALQGHVTPRLTVETLLGRLVGVTA
jgi:DNA polymerase-3 subunit delta'